VHPLNPLKSGYKMKKYIILFPVFILLVHCTYNFKREIIPPYRLTYEQIDESKIEDPEILACIEYHKPRKFIYANIENNLYNIISLPLINLKCGNLYCIFPDVIQEIGIDLTVQGVSTIFTPPVDTIMQLEKGVQFAFLLPIWSPFKDQERLRNCFSVTVDSAGVKKEIRVCYFAQIEKK
jgi:hypothetical protein